MVTVSNVGHVAGNRLAGASSPYLRQHATNPVDWYPWGAEALDRAQSLDRPILCSIGYATCHWCHVMARESFEAAATAAFMNEHFVCIKVDREERPDIDEFCLDAAQQLIGGGGWPLTVFMSPDLEPFFAGTYFPPEDRGTMPSFLRVLEGVARAWRDERDTIVANGRRVTQRLQAPPLSSTDLTADVLTGAWTGLLELYDPVCGGFGQGGTKFPRAPLLGFVLRCALRTYPQARAVLERTLDHMARGGIRDHVAGGFHRYATDRAWRVPHFEKSLYDNAQLASVYLGAWQVTGQHQLLDVARDTLAYLRAELASPSGAFYAGQDAESDGAEGRFYLWTSAELESLLGEDAASRYGAADGDPHAPATIALDTGVALPADVRERLRAARAARPQPALDDKVVTAWNALAVSAFAEAGRVLGEDDYVQVAVQTADFLLSELRTTDGSLARSWWAGRTSGRGYLDDYALLGSACVSLYETTFEERWLEDADRLAHDLLVSFRDDSGALYLTRAAGGSLPARPRGLADAAVPSATAAAAEFLWRLGHLISNDALTNAAESAVQAVIAVALQRPEEAAHALGVLDCIVRGPLHVVIVGHPESKHTRELLATVRRQHVPTMLCAVHERGVESRLLQPLFHGRRRIGDAATAYVCEQFTCSPPTTDAAALERLMHE